MASEEINNSDTPETDLTETLLATDLSQVVSVCNLDLAAIIIQLHFNAVKKALAKNNTIQISNTAIEGKDEKSAKFVGTGPNFIVATNVKSGEKISNVDALPVIQEYVQWFAGPDITKLITIDKLFSIGNAEDKTKEENKEDKANESLILMPSFSNYLLKEDNEEETSEENKSEENSEEKDKTEDKSADGVDQSLGWQIAYKLIIKGKPEHSAADALKYIGKLFSDVGISSFDWRSGQTGDKVTVGDIANSLSDIFGKIDPDQLKSNVIKNLGTRTPKNVEIIDTQTIIKNIGTRLSGKERASIKAADYALCIKVGSNDRSYKLYNEQFIADNITKSIQGIFKKFKNKIDPKDVIHVNNNDNPNSNQDVNSVDDSLQHYLTGKVIIESILQNYVNNINEKQDIDELDNSGLLMSQLFEDVIIEADSDKIKDEAIQLLIKNLDALRQDDNLDKYFDTIYINPETNKKYSFTDKNEKKYSNSGFKEFYSILVDKSLDKVKTEEKLKNIKKSNPTIWKKITKQSIDKFISNVKTPEDKSSDTSNKEHIDFYIVPMKGLKGSSDSSSKENSSK